MTVNLFTFVGLYGQILGTAAHLLSRGVDHARATGVDEAEMLGWRLIEDMNPLAFQLMVVINFTQAWPARAAGLEPPEPITADLTVEQFQAAIADAKAYLAALKPEQFAGRDEAPLTVKLGDVMEPTMPAGQWLSNFATTNILFHLSTAYGILRAHGAPLGKPDMFAGGL